MNIHSDQYFLFAIAVVGAVTLYIALALVFRRSKLQVKTQRMVNLAQQSDEIQPVKRSPNAVRLEQMLTAMGMDMEKAQREWYVSLGRAGILSPDAFVYFLLVKRVIQPVVVVFGIFFLWQWLTGPELTGGDGPLYMLLALIFLVIGGYGTRLYLSNLQSKREHRLQRAFPDALDLMLVCVEAGLSLDMALGRVTREMRVVYPDMTNEFERTRLELNILGDREQALMNLADRTNTMGFRSLVSSLIQSEKFGTNLSDTLRVLAEEYRQQRLLMAENKAARIPAIITIPLIVGVLFPTLFLVMAPALIRLDQQGGMFGDSSKR